MEISVRNVDDVVVLDFSGVWESKDSAEISRSMSQLVDLGYKKVILNLSDMGMIPRKSVPLLLSFCRDALKKRCEIKVVASSTQVRSTLRSGGLFGSFGFYRDETNALKEF
ncbi:MAG: STAS domain-containing protein [bacterium]